MKEEEKVELHVVHTSCKDCVFAQYDGKTQVGCNFPCGGSDRVKVYGSDGAILEAFDNEKEFFIVNGRRCLAFRNQAWATQYKPEERVKRVRDELRQKVDIVIPLCGEASLDNLARTLDSIRAQTQPANSVTVINNGDVPVAKLHAKLRVAAQGLNWFLTDIREAGANEYRALDLTVNKLKGHFYGVFHPGSHVPKNYVESIDQEVVDNLGRFVVLLSNSVGDGLTVALGFHKNALVQGNRPMTAAAFDDEENPTPGSSSLLLTTVVQKAIYIAEAKQMPFLVRRMEEVCSRD